jgi:hypothetical protein
MPYTGMTDAEYLHQYYLKNKERIKARGTKFYREHKEECIARSIKRAWYKDHPEARRIALRKCEQALKLRVLTYYGDGKCACVRCGYTDIRALSIDHINNNGYQHRKEMKANGVNFYRLLEKQLYPNGYQTLCMNCQFIKREEVLECSLREKLQVVSVN